MKKIVLSLAVLTILNQNLFAGAWPQKKGGGYYKLSFRFINAENFYDAQGEKLFLGGTFKDYTAGFYGEYGLTDKLTFSTGIALFRYIDFESNPGLIQDDGDAETGIGDATIGIKHLIARMGQTVVSGGLNLGIPIGKSSPDGSLLLSSGDFNQAVNIQAGHSFYPLPAYFNIFLQYNNRTEGYSDEIKYGIEAGYTFYTDLSVIVKAKQQLPLYNGRDDKIGGAGVFLNNQRYIAYGAELIYKVTRNFGFSVFFESGTAGKNIVSAPVYTAGIFYAH